MVRTQKTMLLPIQIMVLFTSLAAVVWKISHHNSVISWVDFVVSAALTSQIYACSLMRETEHSKVGL